MNSGFVLDQRQNVTKFDPRGDKSCGVADFDAPSPAASPPREPQPAVEEPRSAPEVDAASAGGSVPETCACTACALGVCTVQLKLPPSPSRSGGDSPQEEAVPKRSGEKPAAQEDPCDEFVCMLVFHGVIDHVFFCVRGVDWVTCGLWAGGGAGGR